MVWVWAGKVYIHGLELTFPETFHQQKPNVRKHLTSVTKMQGKDKGHEDKDKGTKGRYQWVVVAGR